MSHFLLNAWYLQDHRELDGRKQAAYGKPFVDAFILNDHLFYDPSIALYQTRLKSSMFSDNPVFSELIRRDILKQLPIDEAYYKEVVAQCIRATADFVRDLVRHPRKRSYYNYFHLLESPLSLFVRESDLILDEIWAADPELLSHKNYLRGVVPFVFSSFLCTTLHDATGLPFLASQLAIPFLKEIAEERVAKASLDKEAAVRQMVAAVLEEHGATVCHERRFIIPDFTAICRRNHGSSVDLLQNALRLRDDRCCQVFRNTIWEVFEQSQADMTASPNDILIEKYRRAMEQVVLTDSRSFRDALKTATVTLLVTSPLTAFLDPVSASLASLSVTAATEYLRQRRHTKRYGWVFFLYSSINFPGPDIG
jgi:hypothetical protein